ncbi:MAG TPA: bifunctional phosphoglucose/phosphomannose isomerase [Chloroflexi bacterium]|nr:bifunctional phosphoglucose/phosphomannose isomerase [Chloroflexota bacterium]
MIDLDDVGALRRNDPQGMGERIAELPWQCRQAWEIIESQPIPADYAQADSVVILGMGGSAIGGDLVRTLVRDLCPVPIFINRRYDLPRFVGQDTLVIASSYSGNTEETLAAFREASRRGAKLLALTTDGELAQMAKNPLTFSYVAQPRAALGFSLVMLLGILTRLGFVPDPAPDLEEAIEVMKELGSKLREEVPTSQNAAKRLALLLRGKLPVIYAAQHLAPVARRWKTQFNENGKCFAFFEVLPELHHNTVEAFPYPGELAEKGVILLLTSRLYHPRNILRFQVTEEMLDRYGIAHWSTEAEGRSLLSQALSTIHFGDYVSLFLAALRGVNPSSVETIAYLKKRLAQA